MDLSGGTGSFSKISNFTLLKDTMEVSNFTKVYQIYSLIDYLLADKYLHIILNQTTIANV